MSSYIINIGVNIPLHGLLRLVSCYIACSCHWHLLRLIKTSLFELSSREWNSAVPPSFIINIYGRSKRDGLGVDGKHKTISSVYNIST